MSQVNNDDAFAPALSQEQSQMGHSDDSYQHISKRHKDDSHDVNDFGALSRAVSSPSDRSSQKSKTAGQITKEDCIQSNPPCEGNNVAFSTGDAPGPSVHQSAALAAYHNENAARMYSNDYPRSQHMHMPYQPEREQYASYSYRSHPIQTYSPPANYSSSEHFHPHNHCDQLLGCSLKRSSSELYSSYQPRQKQSDASMRHHQRPTSVNHNHHQSSTPFLSGHSPQVTVKPTAVNLQLDPAGAQWTQTSASCQRHSPSSHHDLRLSSQLMPDHRQPSNNFFTPPMMWNGQSHYTRPSPPMSSLHGQVSPLPHHADQGMMALQGPMQNQHMAYPNFSQPPQEIITLSIDEDNSWLSEFLCFVRKHCVEVICASCDDVMSRMTSKKVVLGQVGIRCVFCAHLKHKKRGGRSSAFPSSLSRIYQSLTMMIRDHFENCPAIPPQVKERYKDLRANSSQGIDGSKQYWVDSAKKLGLIDTNDGIAFKNPRHSVTGPSQWNGR